VLQLVSSRELALWFSISFFTSFVHEELSCIIFHALTRNVNESFDEDFLLTVLVFTKSYVLDLQFLLNVSELSLVFDILNSTFAFMLSFM